MHVLNAAHINKTDRNFPSIFKGEMLTNTSKFYTHTHKARKSAWRISDEHFPQSTKSLSQMVRAATCCIVCRFFLLLVYTRMLWQHGEQRNFVFPHAAILFPQPQLIYLLCIKNYN